MYRTNIDHKFDKKPKVKGSVLILDPLQGLSWEFETAGATTRP